MLVIGAGPVGLGIAKSLTERHIAYDQVEADSDVGGNWYHGIYRTAHIISSRKTTEFVDFPMPPSYPEFPSRGQMLDYLRAFAEHFGLRENIAFGRKVILVMPRVDELWSVTFADGEECIYKGVLVCTGHHWSKCLPSYPGRFSGQLIHAKEYEGPEQLVGKRILVIGGGNSACDVASEAARYGETSELSLRRGYWFMPKTIFGKPFHEVLPLATPIWLQRLLLRLLARVVVGDYRRYGLPKPDHRIFDHHPTLNSELLEHLKHGRVKPRPDVARFDGDRAEFVDGTAGHYDLIVCATGYRLDFPFLPEGLVPIRNEVAQVYGGSMLPGYKHIYIIGTITPRYGFGPLLSEGGALIANLVQLQDRLTLPLGTVLQAMGQKPPSSAYIDAGAAMRQLKRGKWLLPLLVPRAERRLRRKLGTSPSKRIERPHAPPAADLIVY
ncbi:MAG: hypothetical protein QOI11_1058 [Candidatus Eremiobacteraeota bacterium]|jgi:cation diffusion facilitator CzcD-associated flavoprotein CzcO|nr:hypothetical protein [Candidatus Eremiobacteraeota bacterium]